ncbi:Hypothetical predicted protein [Octopus vulgaris]|uniref:Replication associated protein n=1 Tax=Octopus vulgaris TaxID=6645 RepID=A0AA36BG64_OCTVU|nr:Hypothetical predicted protein [Octopus vulgaris]
MTYKQNGNPEEYVLTHDDSDLINAYRNNVRAVGDLFVESKKKRTFDLIVMEYENVVWQRWQFRLIQELKKKPDPRKIIWYCDPVGNSGKAYLSRYLQTIDGIRFENGRSVDIKYKYDGRRIVVFDYTRSQKDHINYDVIESIKNGLICSTKYVPVTKTFPIPHVVVFANFEPDRSKMSADRWDIRFLTTEDYQKIYENIDNEFVIATTQPTLAPAPTPADHTPSFTASEKELIDQLDRSECELFAESGWAAIGESTPKNDSLDAIHSPFNIFSYNTTTICKCKQYETENKYLKQRILELKEELKRKM